MEWLWLLLFLGLLAVLWFGIKGTEWLAQYSKERKQVLDKTADALAERTEREEEAFLRIQRSREIVENFDLSGSEEIPPEFKEAIDNLDPGTLNDVLFKKVFGSIEAEGNKKNIMATRSAFVKEPQPTAVAKGSGLLPVFSKKQKGPLSKQEQKIYDKIKKS
jgi:hypothetical protein